MDDLFKNLSLGEKNDDEELTKLFKNIKLNRKDRFKKKLNLNQKLNINKKLNSNKKENVNQKNKIKTKPTFSDRYTKNYRKNSIVKMNYKGHCIRCRTKIHKTITNKFLNRKVYLCNKCYNNEACINCLKKDMDCFCDNCLTTFL